jgi:regulator of Ty1 transposition protein 103
LKTLANAEGAVAETLKARKTLLEGLEKLLSRNKEDLATEEAQLRDINAHKVETETKKREVEDGIMRGLAEATSNGAATPDHDPPRPDAEPLTPPPIESITPVGTPKGFVSTTGADVIQEKPHDIGDDAAAPPFEALPQGYIVMNGPGNLATTSADSNGPLPGIASHPREASPTGTMDNREAKRRKMSNADAADEFASFASEGIGLDADVEAMLG